MVVPEGNFAAVMRFSITALTLCGAAMLGSCEKEEHPLTLPPSEVQSGSVIDQVKLGSDYSTQVFYDFVMQRQVAASQVAMWDLAFDARPAGLRVWMNGGTDVAVFNTGLRHFANVTGLPPGFHFTQWAYDRPNGHPDSTGVGEWRNLQTGESKNEVYILRVGNQPRYKFQILSANAQKWTVAWGLIGTQQPILLELPKDSTRNYVYYNFRDAAIVQPEPPKESWDVVFTRYRDFVPDNTGTFYPYIVTGVLLNPENTEAAIDSTSYWANVNAQTASGLEFTNARDLIGYEWKTVGVTGGTPNGNFTVDPEKIYLVRTRAGRLFKLRFLDFYSSTGEKGSPKFEYQRLQ